MEKKRVKKGEKYWYIIVSTDIYVCEWIEQYDEDDDEQYAFGNYFATKEEAESMAKKLCAVLAGADVIQLPSKSEIDMEAAKYAEDECLDPALLQSYSSLYDGFLAGVEWLKSKIIK